MTLTIQAEEDQQRQLAVTIEVAEERVQKAMREMARKLAREVEIPGFRRGKVPYPVLLRRVGEEALRAEATEDMLSNILEEAVEELGIDLYAQPELDDLNLNPLVLKLTIPLPPQVKLGDYRATRKEFPPVEVSQEAIEAGIEHIRAHHETKEPVDRPAAAGDVLVVSGKGQVVQEDNEGEVIIDDERLELLMDPEKTFPGTSFAENVLGLSAGDEKEFSLTFPEHYEDEDLAGKEALFNLTVLDVLSRTLPEVNDELAQKEGNYETLEELRNALRDELKAQAEEQARSDRMDAMIDELLAQAEIMYPPAAVERELEETVNNLRDQVVATGWKWEDYLKLQGKTEETLREEMQEGAIDRVRRSLIMRQFILDEKLSVDKAAVDAALEERVERFDDDAMKGYMREYLSRGRGREILLSNMLMDKVLERIDNIFDGTAPDLSALAEETGSAEEEE